MLFFVFDPECLGSRILAHSSLRFIGIVSYEWFLIHQPVVYLFQDIFGQTHGSLVFYVLKTILPLVLTFGISVIVYCHHHSQAVEPARNKAPNVATFEHSSFLESAFA
jgi:peptidoglycan/LPS O-acetylase OafA/YrhL